MIGLHLNYNLFKKMSHHLLIMPKQLQHFVDLDDPLKFPYIDFIEYQYHQQIHIVE